MTVALADDPSLAAAVLSPTPSGNGAGLFAAALPEALARDDFTNLAVLLRYARDGSWAYALYNFAAVREQVVAALKLLLAPLPVFEWTYSPHETFPLAYLYHLTEAQRQQRAVIFFFDLERASEEVWKALDYNRELFSAHPHNLVFWVTPQGRGRAARQAPHFWAQRSGVFDFRLAEPPVADQARQFVSSGLSIDSREDLQRQLRLYEGLLDDLQGQPDAPRLFLADLHHKAGRAAYYLDQIPQAVAHARAAYDLAAGQEDKELEADILKALGDLALREADLAGARRSYEAALAIYPGIGDRLGEANVQKALGDLALREADLAGARRRYEAALAIYPGIGARLGEANVLQSLGNAWLAEGELGKAYEQYRTALEIHLAINDQLSIAADLCYMGRAAAAAESHAQAVTLFEQGIDLYRRIGELFSQALVLNWQGKSFLALDAQQPALAAWWQARDIARRIGLPLARQLDEVFRQIAQQVGAQAFAQLEADLQSQAEAWRQAGVEAARQALAKT
ncbi:MAG: hypothetical protein K1X65_10075 [Caldilineales bacterium]|nr:hypothetical protein [Caldilineales bacterium]MCW5858658.1 hypothetical protein [Caldilineales bacterium]